MNAAWSAIIVALIGGPLMWTLHRLDRRNTQQHGQAVDLIKEVRKDVKEVKDNQIWMDKKLDRHIEEGHRDAS